MKKIVNVVLLGVCFFSNLLLAAESDPNSYADTLPTIPKNARIALLPIAYDFPAVPQELPVIQEAVVNQVKAQGFTPINVTLNPASTPKEIIQLFVLTNDAHKDVRANKQNFLANLKKQTAYDIAIIPAVVSRKATLSGNVAIWDNVRNALFVKGSGGHGDLEWSGSRLALSIEFDAYDVEGKWLFTSYGGISIPYIINLRESANDLKPRLFESKKDQGYLEKGVEVALKPLTTKIKVSKDLVEAQPGSSAEVNLNVEPTDAAMQFRSGIQYLRGDGVAKDYKQAVHWLTKSAEQGYVGAQTTLGYLYQKGEGIPQDYTRAIQWYTKAAEQKSVEAQRYLGILYFNPDGAPKDYQKALAFLTMAADQGDLPSQFNLGLMSERGNGTAAPKDLKQAFSWHSKAANQGFPPAQFALGRLYGKGEGVTQDNKQAYIWFALAATNGMNANARDAFAAKLTPQVLEQAQQETKVLFEKIEANKPKK